MPSTLKHSAGCVSHELSGLEKLFMMCPHSETSSSSLLLQESDPHWACHTPCYQIHIGANAHCSCGLVLAYGLSNKQIGIQFVLTLIKYITGPIEVLHSRLSLSGPQRNKQRCSFLPTRATLEQTHQAPLLGQGTCTLCCAQQA